MSPTNPKPRCLYPWQHEQGCECVLLELARRAGFSLVYSPKGITRITCSEAELRRFADLVDQANGSEG